MVGVQFACCDSESCQPVKMWSWRSLILYIALGIFLGPMKQVSGQDGFLRCDDKWISGIDVTLRCEVSKASIDTKCDTQQNSTFFKKDDVNQCSVLDNEYANCLPEGGQSEPTSSCWCEQNDTYFIFMHKFKADRFISEGVWTCQKVCFDSGGFNNPLVMSEDSSCDSSVEVSECDKTTCNPPSSCELDRERNKASCVCPFGYFGENCDECTDFFGFADGCNKDPAISVIAVIVLLAATFMVCAIWCWICRKRCTLDLPAGQGSSTFVEGIRSKWGQLIDKKDSTFPESVKIGVIHGIGDGDILLIESKNICSLRTVYQKAKKIIKEKVMTANNEPIADYPPGSLKPSANSETAYGEVSVTPM